MRGTHAHPASRAPLVVLHMNAAPLQVCLLVGGSHLDNQGGVARISEVLRNYFAPEVADAIYRQVTRLLQFRRAEQSVGEFTVE